MRKHAKRESLRRWENEGGSSAGSTARPAMPEVSTPEPPEARFPLSSESPAASAEGEREPQDCAVCAPPPADLRPED